MGRHLFVDVVWRGSHGGLWYPLRDEARFEARVHPLQSNVPSPPTLHLWHAARSKHRYNHMRPEGTPGVIWHHRPPPSGLWLCGSASIWQWRARDTFTSHATPPRTVPHVPPSNFPQLSRVRAVTVQDSWMRRTYSGMRLYDGCRRFPASSSCIRREH